MQDNYVRGIAKNDKWILIKNFVPKDIQQKYLDEYKQAISKCDNKFLLNSKKSYRIDYKECKFDLEIISKAKQFISKIVDYDLPFHKLDGVALLYGINAKMEQHTDSLSRPDITNEEWTFTINIGCDIQFTLNGKTVTAHSGDVLIMDSRAVMHGVERIIPKTCPLFLPLQNARFGIVCWESPL